MECVCRRNLISSYAPQTNVPIRAIQEQVGASEKQCRDDRFLFAGDLLTVNNILYLLPSSLLIRQGGEVQTGRMYGAYAAQICRTNYGHISSRDDNHSAIV